MINSLRRAAATVGIAALVLLAGAAPAAAAEGIAFDVRLYSTCVYARSTPTALGSVSLLSSGGTVLETQEVSFDGSGNASACFDQPVYAGMKLRGVTGGVTRTFTVPKLGFSVDRATDVLKGTAPAGKKVTIQVNRDPSFFDPTSTTFTRTTSSTGTWSVDTTSKFNLRGGDSAFITYSNGTDSAARFGLVPNLLVRIGSAHTWANLNPAQGGNVTLKNSAGTVRAKAGFAGAWWSWDSTMEAWFTSAAGSSVAVRVGDKVSAPFQPSMAFTVPNLTISANAATNTISGSCPAGKRLRIYVSGHGTSDMDGVACSSGGTYNHVMTLGYDVQAGDKVRVQARLSQGDIVERVRLVP